MNKLIAPLFSKIYLENCKFVKSIQKIFKYSMTFIFSGDISKESKNRFFRGNFNIFFLFSFLILNKNLIYIFYISLERLKNMNKLAVQSFFKEENFLRKICKFIKSTPENVIFHDGQIFRRRLKKIVESISETLDTSHLVHPLVD